MPRSTQADKIIFLLAERQNLSQPLGMRKALEDHAGDVLAKAMRGLGMSPGALAEELGVEREVVKQCLEGTFDKELLEKAAAALHLNPGALVRLSRQKSIEEPELPAGVIRVVTPFGEAGVNSYLVFNPVNRRGILFDTGTEPGPILQAIEKNGIKLQAVFFTHGHGDHINGWPAIREKIGAPGFIHPKEGFPGVKSVEEGNERIVAGLKIDAFLTWGHSEAALSYKIGGLSVPLLVTGDSIFARSIGGPRLSYPAALQTIRDHILSQPPESIILPGHGAITTVGDELKHNPFFAA
jgi:hydroxyacylglutathione hydrolase